MRPVIMAMAGLTILAACETEPSAPPVYRDVGISVSEIPVAFRTPLAAMNAIGRGGMIERLQTCEDFTLTEDGVALDMQDLGEFRKMVFSRLGKRAGVATDVAAYDEAASQVTILSRSISGDRTELASKWTLRVTDDRLDCVAAVDLHVALRDEGLDAGEAS